ncbi:hypothetical protein JMJ35_010205 [Cladonia borealis]|uniref:Ketosynthase family 3 (KS3) domain-containing protein n=1 Tax=Cladonia borealis TaxID=184061 RepID=A0AA39QQA4_9LECA|nr:hypothetical protein JMJ35_010205 [Cladonia borealis]
MPEHYKIKALAVYLAGTGKENRKQEFHTKGATTFEGVFLGISNNGATNGIPPDLKKYSSTASVSATMAGRLSYTLDLQGLSLIVDTACSLTLVDMHLPCNALRQGECNMALAGGVSLLLNLGIHVVFCKLHCLSADGHCKAFSEDTEGTGFSEGAAIMVLKCLSDAQRDGDDIHAVLCGTAVMRRGYNTGLTTPVRDQDNEYMVGFDKLFTDVVSQVAVTSNCHTHRGLQQ